MNADERIINPKTGQAVKYGSRVYKNLIKEGILEDNTLNVKVGAGRPKKKIVMEEYENYEEPEVKFSRKPQIPQTKKPVYKQVPVPVPVKGKSRKVEEDPYSKYTDAQLQEMIDNYLGGNDTEEGEDLEIDESQWE